MARIEVSDCAIRNAYELFNDKLKYRLNQKGRLGYIGNHEALGIITEEYWELIEAIKSNDNAAVKAELIDLIVAAWFALASSEA